MMDYPKTMSFSNEKVFEEDFSPQSSQDYSLDKEEVIFMEESHSDKTQLENIAIEESEIILQNS